jgi:hypothetical protein
MPVLPLALVMVGGLLADLGGRFDGPLPSPVRGRGARAALAVVGLVAVLQLGGLWSYYGTEIAAGRSNDGPWRMVRLAEEQRRAREPFAVHADLHLLPTGGGGTWAKALDYLLELEDVRKDVSPRDPDAHLRACDVSSVALRYVERPSGRRPARDEPSADRYWIARPAPPAGEKRDDLGRVALEVPYSLPWQNRSLFDPRAPTFETGCE